MKFINKIQLLFKQGLGSHYVLHKTNEHVYLGNIVYNRGRLVIRDQGYLSGVKPAQLAPCWEIGISGMICSSEEHEWESLSFYGLERCDLPVELSTSRHGALVAMENVHSERLLNFAGSVYRGYQLMLDHHFLPVILLNEIFSKTGKPGFVVSDLRVAPIDISIIRRMHYAVKKTVKPHLMLDFEEIMVNPEQFKKLFRDYQPDTQLSFAA